MKNKPANSAIAGGLFFAVVLWGANNAATKYLVGFWPPVFVGSTRFLAAGIILLALFRWTNIFGKPHPLSAELKRKLWWHGGLNLALYIIAFNLALTMTSASHVALYLGASPIWALLWEGRPEKNWKSAQRYFAAGLALCGVLVLFWPVLKIGSSKMLGELLALVSSVLWTNYGRQCRALGTSLSGAEISAYTFWRAGVLVAPLAVFELLTRPVEIRTDLILVQAFCILASGVVAFALWNNALRHWKTSKVYLFNNLIPISTMSWAYVTLGEPVTPTFWAAMLLIVAGVLIGQTRWEKIFGKRWLPE
ncbi:MAG: DMT family transporter [Verrucomicrobia bacterium]|nr:DMT family transporter [Verrucomicrobiota bacterium]